MSQSEVIIYGLGPSRHECPFDCETWGVNHAFQSPETKRLDKLFLFHRPKENILPIMHTDRKASFVFIPYWDWELLKEKSHNGLDVISLHKIDGVKTRRYPLYRLIKKFKTDYFLNSMCYVIAYAIDQGYKKIRFYGVDMATTAERRSEKSGMEFWVGYAHGMGIETTFTRSSLMLKTRTGYPFGMEHLLETSLETC